MQDLVKAMWKADYRARRRINKDLSQEVERSILAALGDASDALKVADPEAWERYFEVAIRFVGQNPDPLGKPASAAFLDYKEHCKVWGFFGRKAQLKHFSRFYSRWMPK